LSVADLNRKGFLDIFIRRRLRENIGIVPSPSGRRVKLKMHANQDKFSLSVSGLNCKGFLDISIRRRLCKNIGIVPSP
jgi:hypothetical protein